MAARDISPAQLLLLLLLVFIRKVLRCGFYPAAYCMYRFHTQHLGIITSPSFVVGSYSVVFGTSS